MDPSIWSSFKDPRFLLTLSAIISTAGVAYYRLGEVELNQEEAEKHLKEFQINLAADMRQRQKETDARLAKVEVALQQPRFIRADFIEGLEKYDASRRAEAERIQKWMDDQNKFRMQMVEFATETRAATREFRGLLADLKK